VTATTTTQPAYSAQTVEAVAGALEVDPTAGLSTEEAARRLRDNGPNALPA
jgi:hypothetical protein